MALWVVCEECFSYDLNGCHCSVKLDIVFRHITPFDILSIFIPSEFNFFISHLTNHNEIKRVQIHCGR